MVARCRRLKILLPQWRWHKEKKTHTQRKAFATPCRHKGSTLVKLCRFKILQLQFALLKSCNLIKIPTITYLKRKKKKQVMSCCARQQIETNTPEKSQIKNFIQFLLSLEKVGQHMQPRPNVITKSWFSKNWCRQSAAAVRIRG